jgi:hypothetical protein
MDLEEMYANMSPDQRAQLAQLMKSKMGNEATTQVDPNNPSPQQMAALHTEVQQKRPAVLREISNHPLITAGIAGIGAFELAKHFGKT